MNKEGYKDSTADTAINRILKQKKKENRKRGKNEYQRCTKTKKS